MANLLQRIAGALQPWPVGSLYLMFDPEIGDVLLATREDPELGKMGALVISTDPIRILEFTQDPSGTTDEGATADVSPPTNIRHVRDILQRAIRDGEATHVLYLDETEWTASPIRDYLAQVEEMIARGAR